ncbi:MAG: hypothetical protein V7782_14930 [Psychromonas sp.]
MIVCVAYYHLVTERRPKLSFAMLAVISLLVSISSYAQIPGMTATKKWDLNGYIQYLSTATLLDDDANALDHLILQRFNYEYRFTSQLRFNAGMRNRLLWGDSADIPGYADAIEYDFGYWDLSTNWLDDNGMIGNSQFDRLYIDWSNNNWQSQFGRFRINWAVNTLWNPNDIFNSYSIYDFDYQERAGSDAILLSRKLGFASAIDVVYNPNSDSDLDSYASRYLFNNQGWDVQVLAGKSRLDYVLGVGFAGDIKGAGVRGELSWFEPSQEEWENESLDTSLVTSLETDYRFSSIANWVGRIAVLYISDPDSVENTGQFLNFPRTARTLSFTRFTYYADFGFDISSLNRLTLSSSYYDDGSYFLGLSDAHSLSDDWQLMAVLQRFDGSSKSLFGKTPGTLIFAQLIWSF